MTHGRRLRWTATGVVLFVIVSFAVGAAARAQPVNISVSGRNGVVRQTEPGLSCADGEGSYRHYLAETPLAGGIVSSLAGSLRATLDIHYDTDALSHPNPRVFLLGSESHATVSNQRGTISFTLVGGTCAAPTLSFDGTTVIGSGVWNLTDKPGTGAYRQITGTGTFSTTAETNPGADNAWTLQVNGSLNVLQPALTVKVVGTRWAHLGLDYVNRVVSVTYQVANSGPGDAFGVVLSSAKATTPGVRQCGEPYSAVNPCATATPPAVPLGDLASCTLNPDGSIPSSCDSELVTVRYYLDPVSGPCTLVILGCRFTTNVVVHLPDALDVATDPASTQYVTAPLLPPPL